MLTETPPPEGSQAPKIAIVIPVYNGGEYLDRAIQSALNQTSPPAEIAITNDASTDNTSAIIEKYKGHPLVRVQTLTERVIAPVAWNKAIRFSTAPYFIILAHDDLLHPTFIAETQKSLSAAPGTGFIVTGYRVIDETDNLVSQRPITPDPLIGRTTFENFFNEMVVRHGMYFCDTGAVVSRDVFEKVNGFDERFKGGVYDFDFYLRVAAATSTFGIAPCLADYRIHASNMSADLHRDDKGDGDVVFNKMSEYTAFTPDQKRLLVRNISDFQFQHYTRAIRAQKLSIADVRTARKKVADLLKRWATSGSQQAPFVLQTPPRFAARVAWTLGSSSLGISLLRMVTRVMARNKSRWN